MFIYYIIYNSIGGTIYFKVQWGIYIIMYYSLYQCLLFLVCIYYLHYIYHYNYI